MEAFKNDDYFLGRWIAGELSEEELIAFKKSDSYKIYSSINIESLNLKGPEIDTEKALLKVKQQLTTQKKGKTRTLWPYLSAAAMLVISLGFFLFSTKTYTTQIGETDIITLADGSIIELNANSSISHKRFLWNNKDGVSLKGEAFFSIQKSDGFTVKTSKGIVAVLGTQFNIRDRKAFNLKCYEGKVKFTTPLTTSYAILTKGMQIAISEETKIESNTFNETIPSWKKGVSTFNNRPLSEVLEELSIYFKVDFNTSNINTNRLFTGSFKHTDLSLALQATLVPMEIHYELLDNHKTIVLSK